MALTRKNALFAGHEVGAENWALRGGPNFPDSLAALLRLILSLSRRQFVALVAAMGFEGCSAAQA